MPVRQPLGVPTGCAAEVAARGRLYRELTAGIRQMAEEMIGPGQGDDPG